MASRPILSVSPTGYAVDPTALKNDKLRDHCDRREASMRASRSEIEPIVRDISQLTQPARSRFMPMDGATKRRRAVSPSMRDGHGTRASRILQNGLNSGLSSPSRVWFKLKLSDKDMMQSYATKAWLQSVERVMMDFFQATNFYEAVKTGYGELGLFGTEAAFMESHWRAGMVTHPLTFGEYWIAEGDDARPDTLMRHAPMTAMQMVSRFVADKFESDKLNWDRVSIAVRNAYDTSNYDRVFDVMHLCEPNPAWDAKRLGVAGKPWRSVFWEKNADAGRLLSVEGCYEQPFYAARWETVGGGDPWGQGPGWDALADLRALQHNVKRYGDGTDLALKPPLVGPTLKIKLAAGSYTATSQVDRDGIKPVYTVPYQALDMLRQDLPRIYGKIDEAFSVDLFMAITEMDGVQPRNGAEIFSRNEEKLTQLGPVIERVNVEKLGVAIDRTFGIVNRLGMVPPAPPEMQGQELQVDYVSILAQAQRAVGLSTVERSLGFIGNLSAVYPGIGDNIDSDAVAVDYWERVGAPMSGLRDPKDRDAMRADRAKAMAAKQAQDSAPAIAQGAKAAELMSKTDVRGGTESLLDAVTGGMAGGGNRA